MKLAVAFVYAVGSVICHQRPDRSFFWDGQQLPVCARCTGLYLSGAVAFALWWGFRFLRSTPLIAWTPATALRAITLAAIPTAVSWTSGVLGAWDGSNLTRALLAVPLGAVAGSVVAAVSSRDLR
jgi:uncharacterized membrane protein